MQDNSEIRIYHVCEGGIEKPVQITVWHYLTCQVMTNDALGVQIILFHPHTSNGFFSLRFTIWHSEACLVMTNSDPEGRIFLSDPHKSTNGFFFLLTI